MNQEELKELIYYLSQKDISEFSIERADLAVRIKRRIEAQNDINALLPALLSKNPAGSAGSVSLSGSSDSANTDTGVIEEKKEDKLQFVTSPMVGIFHKSQSPNGHPFLREGDMVEMGQIVGMIDVLRLMHEIHSNIAGEVLEVMVDDREPVEYGQPLLAVRLAKAAN